MSEELEFHASNWQRATLKQVREELAKTGCGNCKGRTVVVAKAGPRDFEKFPAEMSHVVRLDCASCGRTGLFTFGMTEKQFADSPFRRDMRIGPDLQIHRPEITVEFLHQAEMAVMAHLMQKLEEKGYGSFASNHEIVGAMMEEVGEYTSAIQRHNKEQEHKELLDVAVAAFFGIACQLQGTMDW
jgi:hypothetical protein